MKRKILLISLALLCAILIWQHRWVHYFAHLANHQVQVIFKKERISERLRRNDIPNAERSALEKTLAIRTFVEKQYDLKNSKSYQSYFNLGRDALGYNITVTPKLSLKPEAFNFLLLGKFDYLGFFDKALAEKWAAHYRAQDFDVHIAEIGGYSTLGWFDIPLYSNQLSWGEYGLVRLLAHEIAHEKLYFKTDTTFSELLASFIERKVAWDYLEVTHQPLPSAEKIIEQRKNAAAFADLIYACKHELEKIYASPLNDAIKLVKKANILAALRVSLQQQRFHDLSTATELLRLPEINNATLVQFHRYTPQGNAFANLFTDCQKANTSTNVYTCWFKKLEKMNRCNNVERAQWLSSDKGRSPLTCLNDL